MMTDARRQSTDRNRAHLLVKTGVDLAAFLGNGAKEIFAGGLKGLKQAGKQLGRYKDHGKLFFIGFNKCGTKTFHNFFQRNGYLSVHGRTWVVSAMSAAV